ncbi:hypothetical protein [Streptomyces sp. NRRL F-5122]|uniref:hypothetical protein n=1 Tax=Streptomyces sp. NRRL F-5122 TaxID=1609098 RepID=UPI001F17B547|nr:hypothetical protein [Streptomyces sp. NRRL F-5122]
MPASPATAGRPELVYIDDQIFPDHDVEPWTELPLWLPPGPQPAAARATSCAKTPAAGPHRRPVTDSIHDTATWPFAPRSEQETFEDDRHFSASTPFLSTEKEQTILTAHTAKQPQTK